MIIAKSLLNARYDNIEVNIYCAQQGEGIPLHTHTFSHGTVCQSGLCKITYNNESFVISNNRVYDMQANVPHEIEALEDNTIIVNIIKVAT